MRRVLAVAAAASAAAACSGKTENPALTTLYPVARPVGLMVTTGGWAYCEQVRPIARRTRHTLLCGRYAEDGYVGPGLRRLRRLDWGKPRYLASYARAITAEHSRTGGDLILVGVSYSGFGVAVLGSRHPELRPDRLIVVDSYLDLVARRDRLPDSHETAREIDEETGGSRDALRRRSVEVAGLARLVQAGTRLSVIWSVSEDERRFFAGATCGRDASAATLARLARRLGRPVDAWITRSRHGRDFWRNGVAIVRGSNPGREVVFPPSGRIPAGAVCDG